MAIPIIVKKGQTVTKAKLENFKVFTNAEKKKAFSFDLIRDGKGFVFGDIEIQSISPTGQASNVATVNGVSSYIDKRTVTYPLASENIPAGKLRLTFKQMNSEENSNTSSIEIEIK